MHSTMSERPVPAPVSDRAALLSTLRTGGVQPNSNRHSMPAPTHLSTAAHHIPSAPAPALDSQMANLRLNAPSPTNRRASGEGHIEALNRIRSAQHQAAARHSQPPPATAAATAAATATANGPPGQPNGYMNGQPIPSQFQYPANDQEMLAQQLAAQQQLQQAELLRLLALQRQQQQAQQQQLLVQQQQLMLLQALQAQAASQQQALHAHSQYEPSSYDDHLTPHMPTQRHSWNPDTVVPGRRAISGRLTTQRSANTLSVGSGLAPGMSSTTKPRAVSSADSASSWRARPTSGLINGTTPILRSPTPNLVSPTTGAGSPPDIVVDDEGRRPRSVSNVSSLEADGVNNISNNNNTNDLGVGVQPQVQRRIKSGTEGLSGWLQPTRQPRGPPTDSNDLESQNFVTRRNLKTRRDALKVLAMGRHSSTEGNTSTE